LVFSLHSHRKRQTELRVVYDNGMQCTLACNKDQQCLLLHPSILIFGPRQCIPVEITGTIGLDILQESAVNSHCETPATATHLEDLILQLLRCGRLRENLHGVGR